MEKMSTGSQQPETTETFLTQLSSNHFHFHRNGQKSPGIINFVIPKTNDHGNEILFFAKGEAL